VRLRPRKGADGIRALKALLKNALRAFGLQCVGVLGAMDLDIAGIEKMEEAEMEKKLGERDIYLASLERAVTHMRNSLGKAGIGYSMAIGDLNNDQWRALTVTMLHNWNRAQCDVLNEAFAHNDKYNKEEGEKGDKRKRKKKTLIEEALAQLGTLRIDWNKPFGLWSQDEVIRFIEYAVAFILNRDLVEATETMEIGRPGDVMIDDVLGSDVVLTGTRGKGSRTQAIAQPQE
jgi:hypothetical protein